MKYNLKNRPKNTRDSWRMHAWKDYEKWFEGFEAKFRNFDAQKWFEENVYEDWTWEGMLEKFIKKEILGE